MVGIYKITNIINHKSYIGKSENIEERFKEHKIPYRWRQHSNIILYKAFLKYGIENFLFEVIEECSPQQLNDREKYWIKYFHTYIGDESSHGYNMTEGGDGKTSASQQNWWDNHPEQKKLHSKKLSGANNPFYHQHHTQETRDKMKEAWKHRDKDELMKNLHNAYKESLTKIDVFNKNKKYITTLYGYMSVARFLGISRVRPTMLKKKIKNQELYHEYYFEFHDTTTIDDN